MIIVEQPEASASTGRIELGCERASRRDDLGAKASPLKGQKSQPLQALASAQTVVPQIDSMPTDSGANSLPRRKEPPSQPRQLALTSVLRIRIEG